MLADPTEGLDERRPAGRASSSHVGGLRLSESTIQRTTERSGAEVGARLAAGATFGPVQPWEWSRDATPVRSAAKEPETSTSHAKLQLYGLPGFRLPLRSHLDDKVLRRSLLHRSLSYRRHSADEGPNYQRFNPEEQIE